MNRERDYERFGQAMTATAEAYGIQFTPQRVAVYFEDRRDLEIDDVVRALGERRRASEFFPTIASLRTAVLGDAKDQAVLAWDRYVAAVGHIGSYQSVDFGDPVMHMTIVALGGWAGQAARLPDPTSDDAEAFGYQRHEFIERYRAYSRHLPGRTPAYLPGIFEITNNETRGSWDHAVDHREHVLALSPDGRRAIAQRALEPGRSTTAPALPAAPEEPVSREQVQASIRELAERLGPIEPRRPYAPPDGIARPPMEQDPLFKLARTDPDGDRRSLDPGGPDGR